MSIHMKGFIAILGFLLLSAIGALIVLPTGQIDYCYIDQYNTGAGVKILMLKGHRAYRPDRDLYVGQSFDEAVSVAGKLDCPLK